MEVVRTKQKKIKKIIGSMSLFMKATISGTHGSFSTTNQNVNEEWEEGPCNEDDPHDDNGKHVLQEIMHVRQILIYIWLLWSKLGSS